MMAGEYAARTPNDLFDEECFMCECICLYCGCANDRCSACDCDLADEQNDSSDRHKLCRLPCVLFSE